MNFLDASDEIVSKIEKEVDAVFESTALPSSDLIVSRWYLLTVAEDHLRFALDIARDRDPVSRMRLVGVADALKYQLKHALALASRKLKDTMLPIPTDTESEPYSKADSLLIQCGDYQDAVSAFSSYHARRAFARVSETGDLLKFSPKPGADRYLVLDLLESMGRGDATHFIRTTNWIFGIEELPSIVSQIVDTSKVVNEAGIEYLYDHKMARELQELLDLRFQLMPVNWNGSLGSKDDINQFFRALQTVCSYHLLAVNIGAARAGVMGAGVASLVLNLPFAELKSRVNALCDCPEERVNLLLELLMLGNKVKSPDPALQPLVPGRANNVMIAPLLLLASSVERNFLTLIARTHEKEFNRLSGAFEPMMTESLLSFVRDTGFLWERNFLLPGRKEAGEVDLVLADPKTKMLVVVELRWTIPPAETREVIAREEDATKTKAQQARTKAEAAKSVVHLVLQKLGLPADESEGRRWTVKPLVIYEGFAPQSTEDVPIVTKGVFVGGLMGSPSLKKVYRWYVSGDWLPRKGVHFNRVTDSSRFGGVEIEWGGVELLPRAFNELIFVHR